MVVVHVTMYVDSLAAILVDLFLQELQDVTHDFSELLHSSNFVSP